MRLKKWTSQPDAGLSLTAKTLGRDNPCLDFFREIHWKQDIVLAEQPSHHLELQFSVIFMEPSGKCALCREKFCNFRAICPLTYSYILHWLSQIAVSTAMCDKNQPLPCDRDWWCPPMSNGGDVWWHRLAFRGANCCLCEHPCSSLTTLHLTQWQWQNNILGHK